MRHPRHRLALLVVLTLVPIAVATSAGDANATSILRVPQDYATIQAAINAAAAGDTVSVSPGLYQELIDNLSKAITIESTGGASVTTIDGGRNGTVVRLIANPGETPVLRGFTIQNGQERTGLGGGGVLTYGGPALVEDNIVSANYSCSGGVFVAFSDATVRDNLVSGTRPSCIGGTSAGIHIGGAGSATITGNLITENYGGISLNAAGVPTISGNTIIGNTGDGISLGNSSNAVIINNLITQNIGNGVSWLVPSGQTGPTVGNNTVFGNSQSAIFADGFDQYTRVFNNILFGIGSQAVVTCGGFNDVNPPILEFNDVFSAGTGSLYGGLCTDQTGVNGNISADPLIAGANDLHLLSGSPAIDAGTSVGAPSTDFDGNARPYDGNADGIAALDMGAFEFRPSDTTPPVITVSKDMMVDATSPTGAVVEFTATATDENPTNPAVTCVPPSGSVFAIGTTTVYCTATDAAGNTANAHFTVYVKGAAEQLAELHHAVIGVGPGSSLADKVQKAQTLLAQHNVAGACATLNVFISQVTTQSGKSIPPDTATALVADANQIRAVLGC